MNVLFSVVCGSYLYGTNVPTSDFDFKGYVFPTKEQILGFSLFEQHDNFGKELDGVLFCIKKFFNLCRKHNPNILELVYAPHKNIIYQHDISVEINRYIRDNMISSQAYYAYRGYLHHLFQQIEKGQIKNCRVSQKYVHDNYDVKSAMHGYRLMIQAMDLLNNGNMFSTIPLPEQHRNVAMDIRYGKYSKVDIMNILHDLECQFDESYKKTNLPSHIDDAMANSFLIDIMMQYLNGKYSFLSYEDVLNKIHTTKEEYDKSRKI